MNNKSSIWGIAGPVVKTIVDFSVLMYEVVYVGPQMLLGEIVRVKGKLVDIQIYETPDGLSVGDTILFSGKLLSVELGPGLLGSVLDGIGRPLRTLGADGDFLERGKLIPSIDHSKKWHFIPMVSSGDRVSPGDVIGVVRECQAIENLITVPPDQNGGILAYIAPEGDYDLDYPVAIYDEINLFMVQRWDVRRARPILERLPLSSPLITGQRVLDTLFPVAQGGAAVLPGGFGTGKTVTQQSVAKWCNADVIVYIGCGERGNEMTEVLEEFPSLKDPYRDAPLMERMVLIANTSNMPVAAREASVYLGMTVAEYYRDMGLSVAVMADSTSRWAEALREIGGRLEEMPGEEGYPAYLGTRLAEYYERAGRASVLGKPNREGAITVINAVSPAGGDFSEPVTQASLRLSGTFWALDKSLAHQRHFPSINWNQSYSLYDKELEAFFCEVSPDWHTLRSFLKEKLSSEKALKSLVQLVGRDGLSERDKWTLAFVDIIKAVYLQQNAFDPADASCSIKNQEALMSCLRDLDRVVLDAISSGLSCDFVYDRPIIRDLLSLRGLTPNDLRQSFVLWLDSLKEDIKSSTVVISDETV
ncbi:V-type ATP synthase subunit A [Dethiosulfovibrio salsuginis]|uniref:V-type ATP synthase alpha chain n=1 Tax=Dethiosulfovibrio salsuginis TaxID=561720 RepID=A0A1X7I6Y4_9BACT|nr:V-type ATP synthase subunit A [Dethiosulfovibrio salsuginis]SMG09595.1 V/A-type H+-transporting ATPase subunit A [Dethiosulfovibrio salsuginis]